MRRAHCLIPLFAGGVACSGSSGGDSRDVTPPSSGSLTVSASPSTATMTAGAVSNHTVTIMRGGTFTGPVTLAVSSATNNVTATLGATSLAAGTTSTTLAVAAAPGTAAGTYPIVVAVGGAGVSAAGATITVTVTAPPQSFAFTLANPTLTVAAGASASVPIAITRSNGFAGPVAFSVSGVPSGVTATVTPTSAPSDTARLTVAVAAGTAASSAPATITVRGTGTGVTDVVQTIALTVTAAATTFAEQYCRADPLTPVFYAIQDGATGAWTRVVPDSTATTLTYRIAPTQSKIALAMVAGIGLRGGQPYDLTVVYATPGELGTAFSPHTCDAANTRTISGSVAGLSGTRGAIIGIGALGATTQIATTTPTRPSFAVPNVPAVPVSVIAARLDSISAVVDGVILRRGVTGSALGTLDFGSTEAFAPAPIRVTVRGLRVGEGGAITARYATDGTSGSLIASNAVARIVPEALIWAAAPLTGTSGTIAYYALPDARMQPDERQVLDVQGQSSASIGSIRGTAIREAAQVFRTAADQTLTLGPTIATPRVADASTSPYRRPTITLTRQIEYGQVAAVVTTAGANFLSLQMSSGYAGSGDWTMPTPDLSGVPGWRPEYAPQAGTELVSGVAAVGFDVSTGTYVSATFFGNNLPASGFLRAATSAAPASIRMAHTPAR